MRNDGAFGSRARWGCVEWKSNDLHKIDPSSPARDPHLSAPYLLDAKFVARERSDVSTSAIDTAAGKTTDSPATRRVGTRIDATSPDGESSTTADTLSSFPWVTETTSVQTPSLGHCLETANTPCRDVRLNLRGMERLSPFTSPSALPLTGKSTAVP